MNFEKYLYTNARKVDQYLDKILSRFLKDAKKTNPKLVPFAKALANSCTGGKRIRGVLVKLGYEIGKTTAYRLPATAKSDLITPEDVSRKTEDIYKIAAAFEILHTSLLIHDDIIDQSLTRRAQPSLYQALGGNHYGISQAINLGDIGLYLPIKIITETNFPQEIKLKTLNHFSQILINTGWGQIMDVVKDQDTDFINLYKTAKYTIAGPLQIGAMLAGGEDRLVKNLGKFGEGLGQAFQLKDDILDREVKEVERVRALALKYVSQAKKLVPEITEDTKIKRLLEGMCDYVVERKK